MSRDSLASLPWLPLLKSHSTAGHVVGSGISLASLLTKYTFEESGYSILFTDLHNIWHEVVDSEMLAAKRKEFVPSFVGSNIEFLEMLRGFLEQRISNVSIQANCDVARNNELLVKLSADDGSFLRVRWEFRSSSIFSYQDGKKGTEEAVGKYQMKSHHLSHDPITVTSSLGVPSSQPIHDEELSEATQYLAESSSPPLMDLSEILSQAPKRSQSASISDSIDEYFKHITHPLALIACEYRRRFYEVVKLLEERERDYVDIQMVLRTSGIACRRKLIQEIKPFDLIASHKASEQFIEMAGVKQNAAINALKEVLSDDCGLAEYKAANASKTIAEEHRATNESPSVGTGNRPLPRTNQANAMLSGSVVSSLSPVVRNEGSDSIPSSTQKSSLDTSLPLQPPVSPTKEQPPIPEPEPPITPGEREKKRRQELMEMMEAEKKKEGATKKKKRLF